MRQVVVPRFGGPEVLTVVERPRPEPAAGEVLVKLAYAGITFGDVYQREGTYRLNNPLKEGDAPLPIACVRRLRGSRAISARILSSSPPYCFSIAPRM